MNNNTNEVLAIVGNKKITKGDLDAVLKTIHPQTAQQFQSEEGMKNLLNELVNQELLYLEAIDNDFDKEENFLIEVQKTKSNMLKQYAINRLLLTATVSDEEVNKFYNDNESTFVSQNSIKASHILVESLEKAQEISSEINNGLNFEEAAKKYSSCPSKEKGGDLGFFNKGSMVPEFEKTAFEIDLNVLSEPVKTQFGYHLIKVTDKKESKAQSFEEVKDSIKKQLLIKKQQELYLKKSMELKNNYKVILT
ncbi:MAG: peptidylprolyl isomerase [Clostridiales bacterium]